MPQNTEYRKKPMTTSIAPSPKNELILNCHNPYPIDKINYKHIGNKIIVSKTTQMTTLGSTVIFFQGELYNYLELYRNLGVKPSGRNIPPEHEIVILLYERYGFEYAISLLNGRFSLFLLDNNVYNENCMLFVVTDPFGSFPLVVTEEVITPSQNKDEELSNECIEHKTKNYRQNRQNRQNQQNQQTIIQIKQYGHYVTPPVAVMPSGTFSSFFLSSRVLSLWKKQHINKRYFHLGSHPPFLCKDKNIVKFSDELKIKLKYSVNELYNYYCVKYGDEQKRRIKWTIDPSITDELLAQFLRYCLPLSGSHSLEQTADETADETADGGVVSEINIIISSNGWNDLLYGEQKPTLLSHPNCDATTVPENCISYGYRTRKHLHNMMFHYGDDETESNRSVFCFPFLNIQFIQYFMSIPPEYRQSFCEKNVFSFIPFIP